MLKKSSENQSFRNGSTSAVIAVVMQTRSITLELNPKVALAFAEILWLAVEDAINQRPLNQFLTGINGSLSIVN